MVWEEKHQIGLGNSFGQRRAAVDGAHGNCVGDGRRGADSSDRAIEPAWRKERPKDAPIRPVPTMATFFTGKAPAPTDRVDRRKRLSHFGPHLFAFCGAGAFRLPTGLFTLPHGRGSGMVRPTAGAMIRNCDINSSNCSKRSDCAPSLRAWSGSGCTSISKPSAPAATAARPMGATMSRRPVPCEGSAMMGRCESFFTTGWRKCPSYCACRVSKVRMPRSHRITS